MEETEDVCQRERKREKVTQRKRDSLFLSPPPHPKKRAKSQAY